MEAESQGQPGNEADAEDLSDATAFPDRGPERTCIVTRRKGMAMWREKLFAWMMQNAESPMQFFRLPTNRVVELGSQVEI